MAKQKVAILTNFYEFNSGYSLTGIVLDQAEMLRRNGHDVTVFCNANYKGDYEPYAFPQRLLDAGIVLMPIFKNYKLTDYRSLKKLSDQSKQDIDDLASKLPDYLSDYEIVFTHDWVFTGWNMIYAQAVKKCSEKLPNAKWLHWIHSLPTFSFDWWNLREYGPNHRLVFPNKTDALLVAESYDTDLQYVKVIPHIKDIRTFFEFSEMTRDFIDDHPKVMQANIVQILPASSDRLSAKRLRSVILLFKYLKELVGSVCLVCANQWATGRQNRESLDRYNRMARQNGLKLNEEFIFTSEWTGPEDKDYHLLKGVPRYMLRELMMLQNLFIFPTREESFGLVVPEAGMLGCLMVLNKSLQMQFEVSGYTALMADFGSFHQAFVPENEAEYLEEIARVIVGRFNAESTLISKTFYRRRYNMDSVYRKDYAPVLGDALSWNSYTPPER